jgi:hypothetical protein
MTGNPRTISSIWAAALCSIAGLIPSVGAIVPTVVEANLAA